MRYRFSASARVLRRVAFAQFLLGLLLTGLLPLGRQTAQAAPIAGNYLVRLRAVAASESALLATPAGKQIRERLGAGAMDALLPERGLVRLRLSGRSAEATLAALRSDPNVLYAEPDQPVRAFFTPNDPYIGYQWALNKVSAFSAWDRSTGLASVLIAVLDTGVDAGHPDLAGKILPGFNALDGSTNTRDGHGHGTHVSGIAAASTNNGVGIAGMGFNSQILPVKVLDDSGNGSYSALIDGLHWATDQGAKVINMSLGGDVSSQALQDAVNYAWTRGVVVVAAAGNEGNTNRVYPGALSNVLCVAASTQNDTRAGFSSYGSWVDVAAPGDSILSTVAGGGYAFWSGTSMATPVVSGEVALLFAVGGLSTSPQAIVDAVVASQDAVPDTAIPGRVNFAAALSRFQQPLVNGAAFVSQSVPASMVAGQSYSVSVTMKNTGSTTWTSTGTTPYKLGSQNPDFNHFWGDDTVPLPGPIAPGQEVTFSFTVTAPSSPGTYPFQWRMFQHTIELFGDATPTVPVTVTGSSTAGQPGNHAAFVSQSVPSSMVAGQSYSVSVTMRNTGTTTWTSGSLYSLGSQSPQDNTLWDAGRIPLPGPVAPGQEMTFSWTVTAPSQPGVYSFQKRMVQDGFEWFGDATPTVPVTVTGSSTAGQPGNHAAFVSQSVPSSMVAGQSYSVSVTMRNTGSTTWSAGDLYRLGAQSPQDNTLWDAGRIALPGPVAPGQEMTFSWTVTAPAATGVYTFQKRMVQDGAEWFGDYTPGVSVTVF